MEKSFETSIPKTLDEYRINFEITGELTKDVSKFMEMNGCAETLKHVNGVAQKAKELAVIFSKEEQGSAYCAGQLHDISTIIPNKDKVKIATELGIEILPEEKICPMILHQKLSQKIAKEIFGINDENTLSAMGCHTTLKENASALDKIVFIADKLEWDNEHSAPYKNDVLKALEISLDEACYCYLNYLWKQKDQLAVIHPWMVAAHNQLHESLKK